MSAMKALANGRAQAPDPDIQRLLQQLFDADRFQAGLPPGHVQPDPERGAGKTYDAASPDWSQEDDMGRRERVARWLRSAAQGLVRMARDFLAGIYRGVGVCYREVARVLVNLHRSNRTHAALLASIVVGLALWRFL